MLFYYSDNQTIYFYRESKIIEQVWWDHTRIMGDFNFMDELTYFLDYVNRFNPHYVILNLQKMFHHVRPDLIPFISSKFQNIDSTNIKKIAILKSEDSTTQRLMEEIIQESKLNKYHIEIFEDEEQATAWLQMPANEEDKLIVQVA